MEAKRKPFDANTVFNGLAVLSAWLNERGNIKDYSGLALGDIPQLLSGMSIQRTAHQGTPDSGAVVHESGSIELTASRLRVRGGAQRRSGAVGR